MSSVARFADTAALIGDIARASMLGALMDGRALTATELAHIAGITPQTASGHLARLTEGGLLLMVRQGRHRYHRLASSEVAHMLESIMSVSAAPRDMPVRTGPRDLALRYARTCYDHLAGRLAVDIADTMTRRGHLALSDEGGSLSADGVRFLRELGVVLDVEGTQKPHGSSMSAVSRFCRPCLDWSERRPHIAGLVGAALCRCGFEQGWFHRTDTARAVTLTPKGRATLVQAFELTPDQNNR